MPDQRAKPETKYYHLNDGTRVGLFYEEGKWRHYEQDYLSVTWYGPSELTLEDKAKLDGSLPDGQNTRDSLEDC